MSTIKSLFIPHVFPNFSRNYVAEAFTKIGQVERVDFVAKQDRYGNPYNAAYIHFKKWFDNYPANEMQDRLETNGKTEFYHDDSHYYWIVLPNTVNKHVPGERKARVDLGDSKVINMKSIEKTPDKQVVCPGAPKKLSYAELITKHAEEKPEPMNLDVKFEECDVEESEEEVQMAEIEAELDAEDENLVSIDYRYVQAIEQENMWFHGEIAQLRMALINLDQMYQAEKAKVRAFSNVENCVNM